MGDDVSALFAKRKEKKQKKTVVSMDAVSEVLQRRARKQEESMSNEVEDEKRSAQDEAFLKRTAQEESDWIDSYENDVGRFEGLKIKDMGADETDEDENLAAAMEQKNQEEIQHKGWGSVNKKNESDDDEMPGASEMAAVRHNPPARYVPPSSRTHRSTANIDINNQEMFPTIGAADEIEKHHKEDKKNPWGAVAPPTSASSTQRSYVPPSRRGEDGGGATITSASLAAGRSDAIAAVRAMSAVQPANVRPMANSQTGNTSASPEPTKPSPVDSGPKKATYIPPHLRNRQN